MEWDALDTFEALSLASKAFFLSSAAFALSRTAFVSAAVTGLTGAAPELFAAGVCCPLLVSNRDRFAGGSAIMLQPPPKDLSGGVQSFCFLYHMIKGDN